MNKHITLLCLLGTVALTLPACNLLKKAARGEDISRGDMVNAADNQVKENDRNNEKIADLEKTIDESLVEIEDLRKRGKFSSTKYRVKRFNENLGKLRALDSSNAKLTSAPKRLSSIESTYTEELYAKTTLMKNCDDDAEKAKQGRMDVNMYAMNSGIDNYIKCRRRLVDVGIDESQISSLDEKIIPEYEFYLGELFKEATEYRKKKNFRSAVAYETKIMDWSKAMKELQSDSKQEAYYTKKITGLRKRYKDPEEVKAQQAKGAFESWHTGVKAIFDKQWSQTLAAEKVARPLYEEGKTLAEASKFKEAKAKLMQARKALFAKAYPSGLALETARRQGMLQKGLSYEIASVMANIYFQEGDKTKLYPELELIRDGRVWLAQDKELEVRLYSILADYKGKLSPKATDLVKRYAGRYSDTASKYKVTNEEAGAKVGESYNMMGVAVETVSYRSAANDSKGNSGKIVRMDRVVDSVSGGKMKFDFKGTYNKPVNCRRTGRVASVNAYTGSIIYERKCQYKKVPTGYYVLAPVPKGVKVRKGDKVSFFAKVKNRTGDKVNLQDTAIVSVSPAGETTWFMGAGVK